MNEKRRHLTLLYWSGCILLLILAVIYWLLIGRYEEYTDDAYVEGNQVYITSLRPGFVKAIHTDDTYLVKKGDLLVELDQTDSLISLEKAKKDYANTVREVCGAFHQVFESLAEIERQKADLIRAAQDFQHRDDVLDAEGVSLEDYQHAVAALRANYFTLKSLKTRYDQALALVQGTSIQDHPRVRRAADEVRDAWVQLYRCNLYAPVDGIAAQRTIQVGMWTDPGKPLLSVIPLDQIWINANFKETQMKHMRIGQRVKITSDLYGSDVVFEGSILGLPGAAGNAFSLLPPQNLSGNWIKIVQRLPVRVGLKLEELQKHPLRIGLSMEATVDVSKYDGLLVPDSSDGSPNYETNIFDIEERGDNILIAEIFLENLDPSLAHYATTPLQLEALELP